MRKNSKVWKNVMTGLDHASKRTDVKKFEDKSRFKEKVEPFFLKSDVPGLPDLWEAKSMGMKMCWSGILLFALIMTTVELISVVQDFRDNPILTTHSLVNDIRGLEFPDVYLCPSNPIHRQTKMKMFLPYGWEENNIKNLFRAYTNLSGVLGSKTSISESFANLIPDFSPGDPADPEMFEPPKDIHEYFIKAGYPMNALLKECSFNALAIKCEGLAEPIFDPDYGKCFLLKTGKMRQTVAGVGLSLELSLDYHNAYPYPYDGFPLYDGVIMKISKKFDIGQSQYSLLSPGTFTRTTLEMTEMNLIQRERNKGGQSCIHSEEGQKLLKVLTADYSVGVCHSDCIRQVVIAHCGCHMPIDNRFLYNSSVPYCKPKKLHECGYPKIYQQRSFIERCAVKCITPCNVWKYRSDRSSALFPSFMVRESFPIIQLFSFRDTPTQYSEFHSNVTENDTMDKESTIPPTPPPPVVDRSTAAPEQPTIMDKLIKLHVEGGMIVDVAYSSLEYIQVTQEPSMTVNTFISNIGGQFGLWIGASIISLVKIILMLSPVCCAGAWFKKRTQPI